MTRRDGALCLPLLLFLTFLIAPARGTAQTVNPVLIDLAENSWVQLIPNPSQRYIPRNYTPSDVLEPQPNPVGRSYSGIAVGDGRVYYFGGGHASYPGNDVELYDIANNVWIQQYQPEVCDLNDTSCNGIYSGWGTESITPLGRPYTEHTYQQHAYDPVRKRFFAGLTSGLWAFDPATSQWTRVTSSIPASSNEIRKWLIYDPEWQTVLWAPLGVERFVYRFDFATNAWIPRNPIPDALAYSDVMSTYDSGRKRHMVSTMNGTMWMYDAVADAWDQITNVPGEVQGASSLAYDPVNKVVLVAVNDGNAGSPIILWSYNQAGQWTRLAPAGSPPLLGPDGFSGTRWGTLVYDASYQVFIFLNVLHVGGEGTGGATETWAYRYGQGPPPPPPPPPPTMTLDFTANPSSIPPQTASVLSWLATNATSCTASGAWSGSKPTSGSESTGPLTASKTYTLTCTGPNGSVTRSVTVNVQSVLDPQLSLSPTTLSFADQTVGTQSAPKTVILTNSGQTSVTVTGIAVVGDFFETNSCLGTLQVASSCQINVIFSPQAPGTRTGTLFIISNATGSPHSVALSGTGRTEPPAQGLDFSVPGYGTLAQEKAYYTSRGWAWTADQEPNGPPNPGSSYYVGAIDVHGDTEADDLWQNLLMWKRTGNQQYYDLAAQWARYFINEYRTGAGGGPYDDLPYDLNAFEADHMWGWGLVDWWQITGDQAALNEAIELAKISESLYASETSLPVSTTGIRGIARHLLLVMRVAQATNDPRWITLRNHIADLLIHSPMWNTTYGTYLWPRPEGSVTYQLTISPVHAGFANWALYRYYEATGNTEARGRATSMARFAQQYALHPTYQYSGSYIVFDSGSPWYSHFDDGSWDDPAAQVPVPTLTIAWIDSLIRGYRLTGDQTLLDRAYYHWERGSKARYGDRVYRAPDNEVGRFINKNFLSNTPFYAENGDLSYAALLFGDAPGGPPPPPPPPSSATISASPTTVSTGGTVTVTVNNGPGNLRDWVGLYLASAPPEDGTWVNLRDWKYLNNTQSPPSTGQTSATLTFTMPSAPGTYHFRFFANDGIALLATSPNVTVTSVPPPPPPPDTEPPTVSMTSPTNGSTVSGTITVSAVASDNVGVVGVQLKLNGVNLGAELTTAPYVMTWDTTTAPNGAQTLTATARDAAGNRTTSAPVTVTVSNIPSPPIGVTATTQSETAILVSWTDVTGETEYRIDRKTKVGVRNKWEQVGVTGANATAYLNTGLKPRMTYSFRVRACNAAGCSLPSSAVSATTTK